MIIPIALLILVLTVTIFAIKWWIQGNLDAHPFAAATLFLVILTLIISVIIVIIEEFLPKRFTDFIRKIRDKFRFK